MWLLLLTLPAAHAAPARTLPALAALLPFLADATLPVDRFCGGQSDDPFAVRACQRAAAARAAALARVLPNQRFYATGTLHARPFDFDAGTYTLALTDLDGDVVPGMLADAEVYMGSFLAEPRAHVFPTAYTGRLRCAEAHIAALGRDTPNGIVGDRYHTLVLDPFTMVSPRMDEPTAAASPLRDAALPVELVVHLEQAPVQLCCDPGTTQLIGAAYPACAYSPFRVIVEEARAEGLAPLGFATEVTVDETDAATLFGLAASPG